MYCTVNRVRNSAAAASEASASWRSKPRCRTSSASGADSAAMPRGMCAANGSWSSGQRVRPSPHAACRRSCTVGVTAWRANASRSLARRSAVRRRTASAGVAATAGSDSPGAWRRQPDSADMSSSTHSAATMRFPIAAPFPRSRPNLGRWDRDGQPRRPGSGVRSTLSGTRSPTGRAPPSRRACRHGPHRSPPGRPAAAAGPTARRGRWPPGVRG